MPPNEEHLGKAHILLVEDNRQIAEMLTELLEQRGFAVTVAFDGLAGLHLAIVNKYAALILDIMLPGMDGLDVARKLRNEAHKTTPILMLTARDTLEDKLAGLEAGADDYLIKPFETRELEARLHALIRRARRAVSTKIFRVGDLSLDTKTLQIVRAGHVLSVPPLGMKLLTILMRESPRSVSRKDLKLETWGDALPDCDTLRTHIYNLRKIIDKPFDPPLLHTSMTMGYSLVDLGAIGAVERKIESST